MVLPVTPEPGSNAGASSRAASSQCWLSNPARRVCGMAVAGLVLLAGFAQLLWPRQAPGRPEWLDAVAAAVAALHL